MRKAVFEFKFLTPALLAGADQQTAEMRIPSIRGALRWWTRLIYGPETENRIFGSVKGEQAAASQVVMRLVNSSVNRVSRHNAQSLTQNNFDYFLWPLRKNFRGVLDAGNTYKVILTLRPGVEEIDEGILKSFLLYGSLGTRSRRAYGSVWPVKVVIDGKEWNIPDTIEDLLDESDLFFDKSTITIYRLAVGQSDYKKAVDICSNTLKKIRCGKTQYGFTASKWGKADHDSGLNLTKGTSIYRAALGLPLRQAYTSKNSAGRIVDYSIPDWDRFASPLHFKVIKMKEGFVPIMLVIPKYAPPDGTMMNAEVSKRSFSIKLDRKLLDRLLDDPNVLPDADFQQLACYPCLDQ